MHAKGSCYFFYDVQDTPPKTENYLVQNVSCAEIETPNSIAIEPGFLAGHRAARIMTTWD